ncbi:MAG: hypothetical protein KDA54_00180 [Phycisphaerales bacterium]|nr:hypothetical protein [Phycisphaerales bacterium]
MNEQVLFDSVSAILRLFEQLPPREKNRLKESHFRSVCTRLHDRLTRPDELRDDELLPFAEEILNAYRVASAFISLHGTLDFEKRPLRSDIATQIPRLFDKRHDAFNTTEFVLSTGGLLFTHGGRPVELLEEPNDVKWPDFKVVDTCYGECKDLQSATLDNLHQNTRDHLDKAAEQLASAQASEQLPFTLACIDIPIRAGEAVSVFRQAVGGIRESLASPTGINFIILSRSGFEVAGDLVEFPHAWRLLWNADSECDMEAARAYFSQMFLDFYAVRQDELKHAWWTST